MPRTKPGPKPGPPGSQRTARLVVRVTPAELSAYQAAAGRAGVSMGEWVRGRLAPEPGMVCAYCRSPHHEKRCSICAEPWRPQPAAAEKEHGG